MSVRSVNVDSFSMLQLAFSIQKNNNVPNTYKCIPSFGNICYQRGFILAEKPFITPDEVIFEFGGVDMRTLSEQQIIDEFLKLKRQSHNDQQAVFTMIVGIDN